MLRDYSEDRKFEVGNWRLEEGAAWLSRFINRLVSRKADPSLARDDSLGELVRFVSVAHGRCWMAHGGRFDVSNFFVAHRIYTGVWVLVGCGARVVVLVTRCGYPGL